MSWIFYAILTVLVAIPCVMGWLAGSIEVAAQSVTNARKVIADAKASDDFTNHQPTVRARATVQPAVEATSIEVTSSAKQDEHSVPSTAEYTKAPEFETARVIRHTIKDGRRTLATVTLLAYSDTIKRSVWLKKDAKRLKKDKIDHEARITSEAATSTGYQPQVLKEFRVELPDLPGNTADEDAISLTESEVLELIKAGATQPVKMARAVKSKAKEAAGESLHDSAVDSEAIEIAPSLPEQATTTPVAEVSEPEMIATPVAIHPDFTKKPKKVVKGKLADFGVKSCFDPKKAKPFDSFCASVLVNGNEIQELRGVDLQRAIHEANAKIGQHVEIGLFGKTLVQVVNDDGEREEAYKNLFSCRVI